MSLSHEPSPTWIPEVGFADRLRIVRLAYGDRTERRLTQNAFADLLRVSASKYKQYEAGNHKPSDLEDFAHRVASVTGCDPAWLALGQPGGHNSHPDPSGGNVVPISTHRRKGRDVPKSQYIYTVRDAA